MIIELTNTKNRRVMINIIKVLFFEEREGITYIQHENGSMLVNESYNKIKRIIEKSLM